MYPMNIKTRSEEKINKPPPAWRFVQQTHAPINVSMHNTIITRIMTKAVDIKDGEKPLLDNVCPYIAHPAIIQTAITVFSIPPVNAKTKAGFFAFLFK